MTGQITGGHRERLRKRFISNPSGFSDEDLLELLLTYPIPREDTTRTAAELLNILPGISEIINADEETLKNINGIGDATLTFLKVLREAFFRMQNPTKGSMKKNIQQPELFIIDNKKIKKSISVFVEDEMENTLAFLPRAASFNTVAAFHEYLENYLPYNSAATRKRRADYICGRFFSSQEVKTPLTFFTSKPLDAKSLKSAIFYELLKSELLLEKVSAEVIWPGLSIGSVPRGKFTEYIAAVFPDKKPETHIKSVGAILHTYDFLETGKATPNGLRVQLHQGTLDGFAYVLAREFPAPGMYDLDALFNGPAGRWMLWDKEWMRKQLYNLRDLGVIARISEIDTVRQFTVNLDCNDALRTYFDAVAKNKHALRDHPDHGLK